MREDVRGWAAAMAMTMIVACGGTEAKPEAPAEQVMLVLDQGGEWTQEGLWAN